MTCPSWHGALWEIDDHGVLRFRCHVGHAFTAETLIEQQSQELEGAMWSALRALEQHSAMLRRMKERAQLQGKKFSAERFSQIEQTAERQVETLRRMLLQAAGNGTTFAEAEESA